jgi:hypothetical protein
MLQEFARAGLECKSLAEYDAAIARIPSPRTTSR